MREREKERERSAQAAGMSRQRGRSSLPTGKPKGGLDPRTPGSRPELHTDTQPLSHPGGPITLELKEEHLKRRESFQKRQSVLSMDQSRCAMRCSSRF